MLNFEEFKVLDEDMQTQLLSLDGVYLEQTRTTRKFQIELYALYNFYVEIFFDKKTEEPIYMKAFSDLKYLDTYLENIDVARLLRIREEGL